MPRLFSNFDIPDLLIAIAALLTAINKRRLVLLLKFLFSKNLFICAVLIRCSIFVRFNVLNLTFHKLNSGADFINMFSPLNHEEVRIKQLDRVRIRTTRNVKYLSAPPGTSVSPKGMWTVVGVVAGNELMISKDNTIVRIPSSDVLKVADHNLSDINTVLGRLLDGKRRQEESSGDEHRGSQEVDPT